MKHNLLDFYSSPTLPGSRNRFGQLVICLALVVLQACRTPADEPLAPDATGKPADQYNAEVALKWSSLHLQLVRTAGGFSPPVAARTFGYAGLTLYESVVPGIPTHRSLVGQLQQFTSLPQPEANQRYNWALSANAAQASILKSLFGNLNDAGKARVDSLENALFAQLRETDEAINERSIAFGRAIATAIFDYSKTDGGHEGYNRNFPADYVVPTGPGLWQPTENGRKIPMQPYWGKNRTFLSAVTTLTIPSPLPVSTDIKSQYFAQYLEVYTKHKTLTQEEKEIAIWWADDPSETFTPPGHSYNIARIVAQKANADLAKTAETLARTGLAVSDAFVMCWKCKFKFNNERPYTYVRRAIDPNWMPFWPAPPFPGYSSGHATQSAAAATVMTDLYGDQFSFTDDSHVGRVRDNLRQVDFKARSYKSFWETAEESAWSRFLGGIHTRQDNDTGLREGRKIGQFINALQWKK